MAKGAYILYIFLNKNKKIKIGRLGTLFFPKGYYCHCGSALNNLEKLIKRHKSKIKKLRWHIDYLLSYGKIIGVKIIETNKKLECILSKKIERESNNVVKHFGSSDCKCKTHLFYFNKNPLKIKKFIFIFKNEKY